MRLLWLVAVLVAASAPRARACAGCSNPNLPQAGFTAEGLAPGKFQLGAQLSFAALRVVHESRCPEIGPVCALRDEPPQLHDQAINLAELRILARYGLTRNWSLEAQLPVKLINTSIQYRRLNGTLYEPNFVGIHHRDETLAGVMDPWLMARFEAEARAWRLGGRLGLTLPIGRTVEDPFAAGERGEEHQHFQFGTGTVNPLLGLDATRATGPVRWSAYALAQPIVAENRHGFRAGHRLAAGLSALVETPWPVVVPGVTIDVIHEEAERWQGVIQQDGNLGRTDLLAGLTAVVRTGPGNLMLAVRTPVYQRIVGGQVSYPVIATLGWQ